MAVTGLDPAYVAGLIDRALAEDLGGPEAGDPGPGAGDPARDATTAATVPADRQGVADLVARSAGVLAGVAVAAAVFERFPGLTAEPLLADGDPVAAGRAVLTVRGPVRALLTAERTALNLLCRTSGVATLTRSYVDAVAGTGAVIRDTRKTTPGLRALEKYAVRCGGGRNHRMSLTDAALVKDNHVLAAGGVAAAFAAVRRHFPGLPVEVEVDTVEQVREVVAAGADLVLLDNMSTSDIRRAVQLCRGSGVRLEASGRLTLDRAREVAEAGVDYLAVGALTHSAPALDIGLDLR